MTLKAAVITASTKGARGERPDESGPVMTEVLRSNGIEVMSMDLVPDDVERIVASMRKAVRNGADLVLTTGGTGLSPNDVTPEATRRVIDREIPGIAEALRALLAAEVQRGPDFVRLANALSALYPKDFEEKRLLDAMLLAVPR